MVDAVVTWVDGSDPEYKKKRSKWLARRDPEVGEKSTARHETRWNSVFELYYCLHLIRKNAPWVRTIFLVTDNQKPGWLTEDIATRLGVEIVDHTTIFSGHEWALPTFNSTAIETMLHRIPGLSDRYLYFNDDTFLIRPTSKDDYFSEGMPKWRGWERRANEQALRYLALWITTGIKKDGFIGGRKEKELLGVTSPFFLGHAPHPFLKHYTRRVIETDNRLESNIAYKFRTWDGFNPAMLVANAGLNEEKAAKGPDDWENIEPKHGTKGIRKRLSRCKRKNHIKTVCIQSIDVMPVHLQNEVEFFLSASLCS
ncbi:stealth family protein [Halorhodospira halophila]|uniref:stealth family protein n=1 Tax=Halorhodospira halophila TaxID=1053 RepID=UPI0019117EB8|nr:stealth family protein [Halorhodospira halophila]MBK5943881.1 hypothetical protein [Halorhodospira halophila]